MKIISAAKGTPSPPGFTFHPQVTSLALTIHRTLKFGTRICLLPREGWVWERERGAEWAEVNCGCSCQVGECLCIYSITSPFCLFICFPELESSKPGLWPCDPVSLAMAEYYWKCNTLVPHTPTEAESAFQLEGSRWKAPLAGSGLGWVEGQLCSEQMLVSLEVIPGKRLSSRVVCLCFFLETRLGQMTLSSGGLKALKGLPTLHFSVVRVNKTFNKHSLNAVYGPEPGPGPGGWRDLGFKYPIRKHLRDADHSQVNPHTALTTGRASLDIWFTSLICIHSGSGS